MINCPLCQQPLYLTLIQVPDVRIEMTEAHSDHDCFCDTYVNMAPGVRWGHYIRWTNKNTEEIFYSAIIPPFRIIWASKEGTVTVDRITAALPKPGSLSNLHYYDSSRTLETKVQDLADFLRICQRFQNLKAFS